MTFSWTAYLVQWGFILLVLIISIFLHELGHYIYFKKVGKKVRIRYRSKWKFRDVTWKFEVGTWKDYQGLDIRQMMYVYMSGIFFGLIPIIIGIFIQKYFVIALVLYFAGCRNDLRNVFNLAMAHKDMIMEESSLKK